MTEAHFAAGGNCAADDMAISQKLHTKLVQKLILTPSLQQAIKLLPMSTLELSELLNQEMVENPLLEESPTETTCSRPRRRRRRPEEKPAQEKTDTWDDQDYEYFFGDYLDDGYRPRTPTEVKELPPIENTLSTVGSLSDHLLWQLSMQSSEPPTREIGEAIIGNLDDDGYLVATVEELATHGAVADRGRRGDAGAGAALRSRSASRRATCRSACCCSCGISGWPARRPRSPS